MVTQLPAAEWKPSASLKVPSFQCGNLRSVPKPTEVDGWDSVGLTMFYSQVWMHIEKSMCFAFPLMKIYQFI